jgi:hypothetical protein
MTIEELRETEWYQTRPELIKQVIELLPPIQFYKIKDSSKQCHILSIEEPESGKLEDITVTVQKTGTGGPMTKMGLSSLDMNAVFGLKIEDLEVWTEEN